MPERRTAALAPDVAARIATRDLAPSAAGSMQRTGKRADGLTCLNAIQRGGRKLAGIPRVQAMNDEIRRRITEVLDGHRIMSIATKRPDGWPQATAVGYVNERLSIYFLCGLDSQKAQNLAHDDRVSLTINDDPDDIMRITGLSLAGRATPTEDRAEAARILALLPLKYPDSAALPMPMPTPDQVRIFRVTPSVISLLDYSKGFGHTDLVTA
jgi:nitroimidazol reductase NimA-like FMN-containing flavoprotein (pyridoxamine 5'-phosphate oxidase superfamily)